ncbi:hypothetical protein, partial [Geothrix paludis]|uniref:hypothetical protein n=1 Tax=Geothrix paludis TaxID=2922722 RepID=UPI001FABDEE0
MGPDPTKPSMDLPRWFLSWFAVARNDELNVFATDFSDFSDACPEAAWAHGGRQGRAFLGARPC